MDLHSRFELGELILRVRGTAGIGVDLQDSLELLAGQRGLTAFCIGHSEVIVDVRTVGGLIFFLQL